jgi:two-component system chemotaxis sensor kinase CheA
MSTAEIQALIFAPGFSTRTAVTEISGRGVGLDVVRANVERLKGNIQVEFTPSKGCLFRITLNSSLATTDA